jgi:hypothetical protein
MQLLKISTIPMKYELEVESAKLEYKQDVNPSCDITTLPSQLEIRSKNAEIHIDTYEARKSLGLLNIDDCIKQYAAKGKEHISKQTREYVQIGEAMADIQNGTDIGDIVRQKMLEQPELYTTFLPSAPAELSFVPAKLDISYNSGDVNLDWQIKDSPISYKPGSVHMKIVQYARIEIQYLGGPMYVPPSADPDFENETEVG